jgi:hypothetical protein
MIKFHRFWGFVASVLTLSVASSYGESFDYSAFNLADDVIVSGSFDGTLNGNVITDVSDASVFINGTSLGSITVRSFSNDSFVDGGAEVSLDAKQNNFFFAAAGFDSISQDSFFSLTDPAVDFNNPFIRYTDAGVDGSRDYWPTQFFEWSVIDTGASPVPDASSTLVILGISVVAMALFRQEFSAKRLEE